MSRRRQPTHGSHTGTPRGGAGELQGAAVKAGWKTEPLSDLCEFQRGLTYSKGDEVDVSDNIVLRATNIDLTTNLLDFSELKYINDKVVVAETRKVKKGSLIICTASGSKSHLGKVAYIDDDYGYAFGGFMGMITPKGGFMPKYLFHLMTSDSYKDFIGELSDGANINNLRFDDLGKFQVPHPKPDEQQRIVGILDEAFEGIATAKANAEKNFQNARVLFESHLQSVFTRRGKGWLDKTLGDVCVFENGDRGKNYPNRNEYVESGIPWINTGHIQPDGTLSTDEMNFITHKKFDSLRSGKIRAGDLVYCLRGATLGKTALVDPLKKGAVASSLVIIRPEGLLESRFLYFFLTSPPGQRLIKGFENGAAQPNLGAKSVAKYPISFPKLSGQKEIATSLIGLRAETQRLAHLYEHKLAALEALKKSLLHQAFTGQL
jgi:type I restriction enzyme, S subunit